MQLYIVVSDTQPTTPSYDTLWMKTAPEATAVLLYWNGFEYVQVDGSTTQ